MKNLLFILSISLLMFSCQEEVITPNSPPTPNPPPTTDTLSECFEHILGIQYCSIKDTVGSLNEFTIHKFTDSTFNYFGEDYAFTEKIVIYSPTQSNDTILIRGKWKLNGVPCYGGYGNLSNIDWEQAPYRLPTMFEHNWGDSIQISKGTNLQYTYGTEIITTLYKLE